VEFSSNELVFVKKWRKCKQGVIFCLSNRVVQFHFRDGSEIVIDPNNKSVFYSECKNIQCTRMSLQEALKSKDIEFTKRYKFIKSVLMSKQPSKKLQEPGNELT
jgi:hypothetical protein